MKYKYTPIITKLYNSIDLVDRGSSRRWKFKVSFSFQTGRKLPKKPHDSFNYGLFLDPTIHNLCNPLKKSSTYLDI